MGEDSRIPVWLDCDPGHDDACAILLAAYHPGLNLLGVSTVHGNAPLTKTTVNALSILEAIGKPEINVFPGAAKPICRPSKSASKIHGESGLAGTDLLPDPTRSALDHCNAILETKEALLAQPPGKAWLVATGPLTNIALLFAVFPELAEHVAGLSLMGGAIGGDFTNTKMGPDYIDETGKQHKRAGNSTPFSEFNIYADPEAARSVLQNPVLRNKTTIIPLDVTHQAYAKPEKQQMLLNGARGHTRLRRMYHELLMFFADTYANVFGLKEGPPLHDPLAVAAILSQEKDSNNRIDFDDKGGERWEVDVILEGEQIGRTVTKISEGGDGVRIPRKLDVDKFWEVLNDCMAQADDATGYEM